MLMPTRNELAALMLAPLMNLVASLPAHAQEPFFARKTITISQAVRERAKLAFGRQHSAKKVTCGTRNPFPPQTRSWPAEAGHDLHCLPQEG
jgi:hypothetical protein